MTKLEQVELHRSHGGTQGIYRHWSDCCQCEMTFAVFLPPQAASHPCPVLWYLSGVTCTHANAMEKAEYRRAAAQHGLIIICPDTSPRGAKVPDDADNMWFGSGAGFYVDATEMPWAAHYQMSTYISAELPAIVQANFPADMARQSIFGHSMGGHGALTQALKHPERYKSCSCFAPIVSATSAEAPRNALRRYLGDTNEEGWRQYDACLLIEDGHRYPEFLVDQGASDAFLQPGLRPWLLENACQTAGIKLHLNMREGYDHSYYFVSSFMAEHVAYHANHLKP